MRWDRFLTRSTAILSVAGLFKYLVAGLLIPVFTVSFLMDMPAIGENLKVLVPPRTNSSSSTSWMTSMERSEVGCVDSLP